MTRFLDDLQGAGGRVVVVFIPEHGAAVRGDRRQIPGLREVPTRAITQVPVGILLVNDSKDAAEVQHHVRSPSSYLAMNEVLSRFIADNPFAKTDLRLGAYTQNLPHTEAVAENEGTTVMQVRGQSLVRMPDGEWLSWEGLPK